MDASTSDQRQPSRFAQDWRSRVARALLTAAAGGILINILSEKYGWTIAIATCAFGLITAAGAWLHRLPPDAPIVKAAVPALLALAGCSAVTSQTLPFLAGPWTLFGAAVLVVGATLVPRNPHAAAQVLVGAPLAAAGLAVVALAIVTAGDSFGPAAIMSVAGGAAIVAVVGLVTSRLTFLKASLVLQTAAIGWYNVLCISDGSFAEAGIACGCMVLSTLTARAMQAGRVGVSATAALFGAAIVAASPFILGAIDLVSIAVFVPYALVCLIVPTAAAGAGAMRSISFAGGGLVMLAVGAATLGRTDIFGSSLFGIPMLCLGAASLIHAAAGLARSPAMLTLRSWWTWMTTSSATSTSPRLPSTANETQSVDAA